MEEETFESNDSELNEKNNKDNIDASFEYLHQNPFTINVPTNLKEEDEKVAYPGFPLEKDEPAGVLKTAVAEFKDISTNRKLLHYAEMHVPKKPNLNVSYYYPGVEKDPIFQPPPPGWNAKEEIEKLTNIDPKYTPILLAARNPSDFTYRLNDIYAQKENDHILENGSFMGKILGGLVGITPIGSIENFYPMVALSSIAKVGSSFLINAMKSVPGLGITAAIHSGAKQIDKVDGNLPDFLKDTFIDAAFATVFFGGLGVAKTLTNVAEINHLKEFSRKYLDGIGFNHVIDEKGVHKGFEAVDTFGNAGAAQLKKAQEMADAAFYKGGLFKIPYVGAASLAVLSGNIPGLKYVLGSPLVRLKTSGYASADAFADSGFDHFLTTVGEKKGGTRPFSFEFKVKKTRAMLTRLKVDTVALHAERNGYSITARPTIGIQNAWSAFKQKSLETLAKETKSQNYTSEEDFMDEIQNVLFSGKSSEHNAVNEAAQIYRTVIDDVWKDYRAAHNLPDNWLPPKTAVGYLMRVYDIDYLTTNQDKWVSVVSKWLSDSDEAINARMAPIKENASRIEQQKVLHENLLRSSTNNAEVKSSAELLEQLKRNQTVLEEQLQNELRNDDKWIPHVDDFNKFSADEAKEFKALVSKRDDIEKEIQEQKSIVATIKAEASKAKSAAMKAKTAQTGKKNLAESDKNRLAVQAEEEKLRVLEKKLDNEIQDLQDKMTRGEVNPRFYYKEEGSEVFKLKNPNERLAFRTPHESDFHRNAAAQAYYNSILNMRPEDIVADVYGRVSGRQSENVLKSRTLAVPDEILYANNFMTKDLYAKTANYVNYLSRRTHLKTSFNNVTVNGGFEELALSLLDEHKLNNALINKRKDKLNAELDKAKELGKDTKKLQEEIRKENKSLKKEKANFEATKYDMKYLYENRMMGLNKRGDFDEMFRRTWMSLTAAFNLHNLPATQIGDVAFGGFQHGIWPYVRDGIYPIINSLGGILKTKDSEALRKVAPHLNLGLQDTANNFADKNWHNELQPYLTMGKINKGVERFAQFSANTDLSPYIDNGMQHMSGSVIQSNFMQKLIDHYEGKISKEDSLYLRKYGIDPDKWSSRMVKAYEDAKGFKTALGGRMSNFWMWQDLEASNLFADAVFRGIQNTLVWKGMSDSPFFADNILGLFFHTFTGWGYAATNRYIIPSLQHPDASLLIKALWMYGMGSLVSPTRRIIRGEDPWPEDMTETQIAYEAFSDSGLTSNLANVLNLANYASHGELLGDLKNDKFRNRARTGIFGISDVVSSTANRMSDVLGMAQYGLNEKDMKTLAHMLPITGAMYGHYLSDKLIESWNLPRNRRAAKAE